MTLGADKVETIMTKNIHYVRQDQNIRDAIDLMAENDIRHLIVRNEAGQLAGIISKNDVDKFKPRHKNNDMNEKIIQNLHVEQMMTRNVRTIESGDSIKYAAEVISHCSYNALPVTDEDDKLVGIITTTDLLNYLLRHC